MATEERIEELERKANEGLAGAYDGAVLMALVFEVRALRLMLKDELRELGWKVQRSNA